MFPRIFGWNHIHNEIPLPITFFLMTFLIASYRSFALFSFVQATSTSARVGLEKDKVWMHVYRKCYAYFVGFCLAQTSILVRDSSISIVHVELMHVKSTVSGARLKTLTDCFFRHITLNSRICSFITLYLYMVSLRNFNKKIRFFVVRWGW